MAEGLKYLYRRSSDGKPWEGALVHEDKHGQPLIHEILARIGAIDSDADFGHHDIKEEGDSDAEEVWSEVCVPTPSLASFGSAVSPDSYKASDSSATETSFDALGSLLWYPIPYAYQIGEQQMNDGIYLTPPLEQKDLFDF